MSVKGNYSEFAILGGGIAGLSVAIGLKNLHKEVRVFEAAPEFKPFGAGITLAVNAMKAYRYLGIHKSILEQGNPISRTIIKDEKGGIIGTAAVDQKKWGDQSLAIHRADLQDVLLGELSDDIVLTRKKTIDIEQANGRYTITFANGSQAQAKYVIDAQGIHSIVREKLLPGSTKRFAGYTCWRGIAKSVDVPNELSETWGKNGGLVLCPLPKIGFIGLPSRMQNRMTRN